MITKISYKGLKYTLAKAETGGICLNVYDDNTKSFIFSSGICKNKKELHKMIINTKDYYNDILNQCLKGIK